MCSWSLSSVQFLTWIRRQMGGRLSSRVILNWKTRWGGDSVDGTRAVEGRAGKVGDVPQGVALGPCACLVDAGSRRRLDLSQLGQGELDGPLVALAQLQAAGEIGHKPGDGLALGLGESDRERAGRLLPAWHGVPPGSRRSAICS
jgi:hypothetical protein